MGSSQLPLNILREDQEFIFYRGEHSIRPTEHLRQTAIVLEDPGGKALDRIFV